MSPAHKTIVLVEDDAIVAMAEADRLEAAGYTVIRASSGEEAIERVRQHPGRVDRVLMSVDLGRGTEGTEAARGLLRELERLNGEDEAPPAAARGRDGEERFRLAMEATADGLWDQDVVTGNVYYSPAYYGMLGYSEEEFRSDAGGWKAYLHPEDRERAIRANDECQEGLRGSFDIAFRMRAKDGAWKWVNSRGKAVARDAGGRATRMIGTHVDITERVGIEEALRKSEDRWRSLIAASPDGIVETALDGTILFASDRCGALFGYGDARAAVGESFLSFIEPSDRARAMADMEGLLRGGKAGKQEYLATRKDGSSLAVEINSELMRGEADAPLRVVSTLRDISERRRKDEELGRSQSRYLDLLNSIGEGFCYLDENEVFRMANPAAERILGVGPGSLAGKPLFDFLDEEGREIAARETAKRRKGESTEFVSPVTCFDGRRIILRINASPLGKPGEPYVGNSVVLRDITEELKVSEALNQLVKAKELLMKELEHRVKNSLSIVSSLLKIAANEISDPRSIGVLADAEARIRSLSSVYERLYQSESVSSIDFGAYAENLARSIFGAFLPGSSRVRLVAEVERIELDTKRAISLGLILNELLTNAAKHAFPGDRTGTIRVALASRGDAISLSVSDDGAGLPDIGLPETSMTMGMTLIRMLTEQIGGSLRVSASEGTAITISFAR